MKNNMKTNMKTETITLEQFISWWRNGAFPSSDQVYLVAIDGQAVSSRILSFVQGAGACYIGLEFGSLIPNDAATRSLTISYSTANADQETS